MLYTCMKFYTIGDTNGFLKRLTAGGISDNGNMLDFIRRMVKHSNSLVSVTLTSLDMPHHWIPGMWPKHVHFDRCTSSEIISPDRNLVKNVVDVVVTGDTLNFDSKKFPNIRQLRRFTYHVDRLN